MFNWETSKVITLCACMRAWVHAFVRACVYPVDIWINKSPAAWCILGNLGTPHFKGLYPPLIVIAINCAVAETDYVHIL